MRATEFLSEDETPRIKIDGSEAAAKARAWIEKVYAKYPQTMQNNHVMTWGSGDDLQFAMFELVPSFSKRGAVEVKWIQAYPLRQGVGSRAMKELQALAREDGISLTLFPWDKGQVSQAKLTKFYRGQGFAPTVKGGKAMQWSPELAEDLNQGIPSVLYHATYKPRLKSIKLKGLGAGGKRNWEDSKSGVIYLALDPNVAESYAESSDMVPDEWLDQIVILKISTAGLDPSKFSIDSNVQDNTGDTVEYHGVIPVSNISLYKQGLAESLRVDVPNEEWLQDAIEYAKRKSPTHYGLPYMGKTTATVRQVEVPVNLLRQIPGMRREQQNVRQEDLAAIMKIMKDTGKLPIHSHSGEEYKPFINVAYDGSAWVNEGNHRIMAAYRLGWDSLPVEISYFDGGERVESGPMYPGKIGL